MTICAFFIFMRQTGHWVSVLSVFIGIEERWVGSVMASRGSPWSSQSVQPSISTGSSNLEYTFTPRFDRDDARGDPDILSGVGGWERLGGKDLEGRGAKGVSKGTGLM